MRNLPGLLASSLLACVLLVPAVSAAEGPPAAPELATEPLRLAIRPSWVHSFRPSSVSADGVGLAIELFPGKTVARGRLGFAVVGSLYAPFSREQTRSGTPLTETLGFVNLESRYVFLDRSFLHLEAFGGVGVIGTQPVSLIDPTHRHFDFSARLDFEVGAGLTIPVAEGIAVTLEGRNLMFVDQHESPVAQAGSRDDRSTWYGDKPLVDMIEARVGLTMVLTP